MADKGKTVDEAAANGEVQGPSPFQALLIKMAQLATMDETEGNTFAGDDITSILTAQTEEEMWDADERPTFNAKMLSGCELQLLGFEVKYGAGNNEDIRTPFVYDGRQMYVLVHAFRLNRAGDKKELRLPDPLEEFTWNTSARFIVGKLFWMLANGWFDRDSTKAVQVRIVGTELTGGRSVEKLKPLQPATVPAEAPF
jgi:hypothetical protein